MRRIPWKPEYGTPGLTAVMVPPGELTERQWIQALADRVTDLVNKEPDPQAAMEFAARALDTVIPDYPAQAGQVFVENNWALQTVLTFETTGEEENTVPAKVTDSNPIAQTALEETDLEMWVELAVAAASPSSLD